ncbi:MAG TPA: hypothetical protein VHG71_00065 [Verrucomicrobiae bacterium]|nr:hypothetical protein [Verrucomicrobiae bacterium]
MNSRLTNLDCLIGRTLAKFENWLISSDWRGRENECVNLFAHGFLFKEIGIGKFIEDFTQVGIEVSVPQPKGIGTKAAARKDLVIWNEPRETTFNADWSPVRFPISIIEWKARRKPKSSALLDSHDIRWLNQMSLQNQNFLGYAVAVDFTNLTRRVFAARLFQGVKTNNFHQLL